MAASLLLGRATFGVCKGLLKSCAPAIAQSNKRFLLSQAYSCKEAWRKRLEDPVLNQVRLSEFAIQLRDQYDKQKTISAVDMEILANKLHEMDIDEADFMEDLMIKSNPAHLGVSALKVACATENLTLLLKIGAYATENENSRFRRSPEANPVRDSIVYVIVRNYISSSMADRLLPLMQARSQTGIFPDVIAFSLLLDHFIEEEDFASASQVAYEMMLQENFTHPTSRLLSLHACVRHLENVSLDDIAPAEIKDPEGEEEWIPVKYIRYPTYDDHFDIKSQQHLLGKTLYYLGKEVGDDTLGYSLRVSGLALYHKFSKCFQLLAQIADSGDGVVVHNSLTLVKESLEKAQTRDPEKPEKEVGLLTIDDEIYKLLPTQGEKDSFLAQLQQLQQTLQDKGKVVETKLSTLTDELVNNELSQHEAADMEAQTHRLEEWQKERQTLLQKQLYELEKKQKVEEIENTLKELQEKEEMIRFFELNNKIRLIQPKKLPKDTQPEEEDEEALRAKRIKRRKFRHNV